MSDCVSSFFSLLLLLQTACHVSTGADYQPYQKYVIGLLGLDYELDPKGLCPFDTKLEAKDQFFFNKYTD